MFSVLRIGICDKQARNKSWSDMVWYLSESILWNCFGKTRAWISSRINKLSSANYKKPKGKRMDYVYNNGMVEPLWVEHIFWRKNFCFDLLKIWWLFIIKNIMH